MVCRGPKQSALGNYSGTDHSGMREDAMGQHHRTDRWTRAAMVLIVRRGPKKSALGNHSGTDQCLAWGEDDMRDMMLQSLRGEGYY